MSTQTDLDTALKEVGRIGRYQMFVLFLIFLPLLVVGTGTVSYVFIAAELDYRCRIDECDALHNPNCEYKPDWLRNAVPFDEDTDRPERCYKYNLTQSNLNDLQCEASDFNRVEIKCNDFIYANDKRSIVNDMDLHCEENKWKLTLVGTIHNCGSLINLVFIGYFSDKYGRRAALIFSAVTGITFGLIRTFTWDYASLLVFEFLPSFLGAGVYTSGLILIMEIVKPEHRSMISALVFAVTSTGKVLHGVTAMLVQSWRTIIRINLPLSYITIAYFWLLPESIRWLLSQGKSDEAAKSLLKITRINKTEISTELREILENRPHDLVLNVQNVNDKIEDTPHENKFQLLRRHPQMIIRVAVCACCWIIILMVFYGLSLMAVAIGGDKYIDFILVQFMEIPAALSMPFITSRFGRKKIMLSAYIICGAALIIYTFVGEIYGLKLALFLIGKLTIAIAMSNIYIYSSELFPTNLRHTLLGICSGVGRIGSLAAPQAPLLNSYVKNLSMYIFGVGAIIAALLTLYFPETLNTKLPDTIEEALNTGKEKNVKDVKT